MLFRVILLLGSLSSCYWAVILLLSSLSSCYWVVILLSRFVIDLLLSCYCVISFRYWVVIELLLCYLVSLLGCYCVVIVLWNLTLRQADSAGKCLVYVLSCVWFVWWLRGTCGKRRLGTKRRIVGSWCAEKTNYIKYNKYISVVSQVTIKRQTSVCVSR